jgi:hypothetical protein
MKRKTFT